MNIIDIHTHCFPDAVAAKAMAKLTASSAYEVHHNGTLSGLLSAMDSAKIDKAVICSIATKPHQIDKIIDWSRKIKSRRIEPFFSLYPGVECEETIEKAMSYNLIGVKMHPQYQNFEANDKFLFSTYAAIEQSGLILTMHSGYDLAYPGDEKAAPAKMAEIKKNFPKIKLVLAHFGGYRMWQDVLDYVAGKEIYLDTSFILRENPEYFYKIIQKHGTDYLLFGTDSPWLSQQVEKKYLLEARISDKLKEKIFFSNAQRLLSSIG